MRYALAILLIVLPSWPAASQTVEELKAQLEAQKQLNELLKQRVETLEAKLAGRVIAPPPRDEAPAPEIGVNDPEGDRALERALVRRGTAVLPAYVAEVTPSLSWSHSGRDALSSTRDTYVAGLDARVGLPDGWMVGASVPFLHRDIDSVGDSSGLGDVSATVWKSFRSQDDAWPSLVGSLRYGAPTGDDFSEENVALGSGFHRITGRLSAVKTIDPVAFFGDVAYTHFLGETISGVDLDRDGVIGFGFGANLAATPDISMNAGFDFAFEGDIERDGVKLDGTATTVGLFEIGAGFVLTQDVFLSFSGGIGVTDDSPDVILNASLPIRF